MEEFILHGVRNAAHVTGYAEKVHGEEGTVEKEIGEGKVNLAQRFVQHAAEHLGKPVVERREHGENDACDHIVKMGNDEIGVVDVNVHRGRSHVNAAQSADDEIGDKSQSKEHGTREVDVPTPQRA